MMCFVFSDRTPRIEISQNRVVGAGVMRSQVVSVIFSNVDSRSGSQLRKAFGFVGACAERHGFFGKPDQLPATPAVVHLR